MANCWWTAAAAKRAGHVSMPAVPRPRTYATAKPNSRATLVMVPTALVRPSLNTNFWSQCKYSGVLMKRKWTEALSPVRKQSLFMDKMVAVCRMLPQWTEDRGGLVKSFGSYKAATSLFLHWRFPHPWPGIWGISSWDDAEPGSRPRTPTLPVGTALGKPSPCLSLWTSA